jgi:hypothetical protein
LEPHEKSTRFRVYVVDCLEEHRIVERLTGRKPITFDQFAEA